MSGKGNIRAMLACLLVYTIFGLSFLISRIALNYADPMLMIAIRFLSAFFLMNVMMLSGKFRVSFRGKPVGKLLLMGLIQPILYFIFETYGIVLTSSSFAGIILGLLPMAGMICGNILLRERFGWFEIVCVLLSVAGVALTTVGGAMHISALGLLLLLGAVLADTLYAVLSRNLSRNFSSFERTYIMFFLGSVFFTVSAVVKMGGELSAALSGVMHLPFWLCIFYLAAISSVAAFMLLNFALNDLEVGTQTLMSNFCTVVSVAAGVLVLHEPFSVYQLVGTIFILVSVVAVTTHKKQIHMK